VVSRAFRWTTWGSSVSAIEEQTRPTVEELGERLRPRRRLERVVLLDRHPGQLPPLPRELIAASGELLLFREQLVARRAPLVMRSDLVVSHWFSLLLVRA
jgi:hypothetical protein